MPIDEINLPNTWSLSNLDKLVPIKCLDLLVKKMSEDFLPNQRGACQVSNNSKENTNYSQIANSCPCIVVELPPTLSMGSSIMLK